MQATPPTVIRAELASIEVLKSTVIALMKTTVIAAVASSAGISSKVLCWIRR